MTSSQALQASSLVGRSVLVQDNVFGMSEGEAVKGKLVSDTAASNVNIYVENIAGEVVQTVPVGNTQAGGFTFTWDGQTANGEAAAAGAYRFRIVGLIGSLVSPFFGRPALCLTFSIFSFLTAFSLKGIFVASVAL